MLDKAIRRKPDAPPNELMAAARRPTVIIAIAAGETRQIEEIRPRHAVSAVGTAGSAAAFSAAGAGNEQLFERLKDGDLRSPAFYHAVGIFAILAVRQCAHAVLRGGSVDWSLPVFLPSLSTGSLGAQMNNESPHQIRFV